jgi:hypothetical protein
MPAPVGDDSVKGGTPSPYTVADDEKMKLGMRAATTSLRREMRPPMLLL